MCCVVVTSRGEPPAALARLRATGLMCYVTGTELTYHQTKSWRLPRRAVRSSPPKPPPSCTTGRRGWVAGLVLMLEHSKFSGRIVDLPSGATPQVIFDYLAGEIFDRFDPGTREFMLRIACLPRTTVKVAEALSGEPKAGRLLVNLALNDYFVREVPSEAGRLYQVHPLAARVPAQPRHAGIARCGQRRSLQRAALLLRDAGQIEDADRAARRSRSLAGGRADRIGGGRHDARARGGARRSRAGSTCCRANCSTPIRVCCAFAPLPALTRARGRHGNSTSGPSQAFRRQDDADGMVQSCCGIVNAIILEFDDVTPLDRWIEALGALLAAEDPGRRCEVRSRGVDDVDPGPAAARCGNPRLDPWLDRAANAMAAIASGVPEAESARRCWRWCRRQAMLVRGDLAAADAMLEALRSRVTELPSDERLALAVVDGLHHVIRR